MIAETLGNGLGITRRCDDAVALGERAFCNEGAKSPRGAGDEPGFHRLLPELKDVGVRFTLAYPLNRSGQHLGEFDQIAKRVGEESELATDGGQDEWLGDDHDATRAKLGDRFIHAGNAEAEMVVAAIFQAIAKVRIGPHFRWKLVAAAEHLDVEMIVRRRRQISELLVGIRPFRYDAEIELANIEILSLRQTRRTHRHMVAAHIGEG